MLSLRLSTIRAQSAAACCALAAASPFTLDYVVQPGDTVSGIAADHDTTVRRIVAANDLPAAGNLIYAGEVLRIPAAHPRPVPGGARTADRPTRRIVVHIVRPGDTLSDLAVRYHAWTAELTEANGGSTHIVVGQRLRIPVVVSGAGKPRADDHRGASRAPSRSARVRRLERRLAHYPDPSRAEVRRIITATARRHGVDPNLALAVSWQEAGWQQHHVSAAEAVGAMQVIPTTGSWVSTLLGRDLDLLDVRDNATAGVVLLDHLTDVAPRRQAVAGYYQGLAGVREHGMYADTRRYVANVLSLYQAFERGAYPA